MNKEDADKMLLEAKTLEELKTAVNAGANVKEVDKDEPLLLKFINDDNDESLEAMKFLLMLGASCEAEVDDGDIRTTPFLSLFSRHSAKKYGDYTELEKEKIKLMIKYDACVNHHEERYYGDGWDDGYFALDYAILHESLDVVKLLVSAGADIDRVDSYVLSKCKNGSIHEYIGDCKKAETILKNKAAYEKAQKRDKIHNRKMQLISGAVIADKIADKIREGSEKRIITPDVGKRIRTEIMKERCRQKDRK